MLIASGRGRQQQSAINAHLSLSLCVQTQDIVVARTITERHAAAALAQRHATPAPSLEVKLGAAGKVKVELKFTY